MKHGFKRSLFALVSAFILLVLPNNMYAVPQPYVSMSNKKVISRIVSIATHASTWGTTVNVLGNGKIPAYVTKTQDFPPRITIDIFCAAEPLETINVAVESSNLKGLRVGHHLKKIRIVLDIQSVDMPTFAIESFDNELTIFLNAKELTESIEDDSVEVQSAEGGKEIKVLEQLENIKTGQDQQNASLASNANQAAEKLGPAQPPAPDEEVEDPEQAKRPVAQIRKHSETDGLKDIFYGSKLIQIVPDDGQNDTAFLIESINAYQAQNWSGAIENLDNLIKTYPDGRYSERAYFLLAKAYEQYYSKSILDHFAEIKKHYEDASFKFPVSEYVPEAFLGIGNLLFETENYYESLAYYNLVIKKAKGSILAARALMQKTKIMLLTKRKKEALSISVVLEDTVSRFPDMPVKTEAKILIAKILYEMNKFRKSRNILSELLRANPRHIYQYPVISLYLGYNYFQLEDYKRSRENLLRFYNSHPDQKMIHLILTQIGDAYQNEGLVEEAERFYRLVLRRYPGTEGSVISKIRLAEQQEENPLAVQREIVPPVNILDEDVALATEFYKEIINNPLDKKDGNPLTQLALLKLSIVYQKEKKYKKSIEYLKKLFEEYPESNLRKEGEHAFVRTIDGFFKEEMKEKKYSSIINFYMSEKELISTVNAPELFISIARALVHQNFEDMGTEMFARADPLLADEEKPADLLFLLGRQLYNREKYESALKRFSLLIENYPSDKNVSHAYRLKGSILLKQKRYPPAAKMFSAALKYPAIRCEKLSILLGKAQALAGGNFIEKAKETAKRVDGLKSLCSSADYNVYQEIGDLYFNLGDTEKAISIFNKAIAMAKEKADKISLMLKVAQGYRSLNKKEDFLALYQEISDLNDPFWSNLAKERMEEIDFNWEINRMREELKKREKI